MELDDDLKSLLSEQRRELLAAQSIESDLLFAYQLQMQEAMNASLAHTGTSAADDVTASALNPISFSDYNVSEASTVQLLSYEINDYERRLLDQEIADAEYKKIQNDLNRKMHDHAFAREILNVPEKEWRKTGDEIRKPFLEGSPPSATVLFRVYVTALMGEDALVAGIGFAICDMNDTSVLEVSKGVVLGEMSLEAIEIKAVIESLNAAIKLGLKRIQIITCSRFLYQCVTGKLPKNANLAILYDQVYVLQRQLKHCDSSLVGEKQVKFAFELARNAIASQANRPAENNKRKSIMEICAICFENMTSDEIFLIDSCLHGYCLSCMRSHIEFSLLHGILPKCPHENCKSELKIDECEKFLTQNLLELMRQHVREASINPTEKIYCPYRTCSELMSISELAAEGSSVEVISSVRTCRKCHGRFCINCKVPWHDNMTCYAYKRLNPYPVEDEKLKYLAKQKHWQRCPKCQNMVSLSEGCNHIYCRCGHEFCYVCRAEWKGKKQTCSCPLWQESNIIYRT